MRLLLSFWASTLLLFSSSSFAAVEMLDRVVAIIDNQVITQTELDTRIKEIVSRNTAAGVRLPSESVLREQILEQLVNETLQLNAARRYGVTATDQEVVQAINNLMASRRWTQEQLIENMARDGMTLNDLTRQIHRQLLMQHVSQGLVSSRIKISEQDIDNFLKSADAKFWISPDYNLSHILISVSSTSNIDEVQKAENEANALYEKLKGGANFHETALAESDGPLALKGGNMGWRKSSDLPTLFAEVAPKLEVGEVAAPIRSRAGFHILKLNNKKGETKQIVNQTKARHILLKTSEILDDNQAEEKLGGIRQQIVDGADFAELAKEHSEDIGSALSGGDLGWAMAGDFVPAFTKAMEASEIGEISQPFKSKFGWHILQVQDRRAEDMTEEAKRAKARNLLMSRRFEDEVQLWIQEMRDEAFIDIKI